LPDDVRSTALAPGQQVRDVRTDRRGRIVSVIELDRPGARRYYVEWGGPSLTLSLVAEHEIDLLDPAA
jgi:hypothetical protein